MQRGRTIGWGIATWFGAFVATVLVAPVRPVERTDEAWMLWVFERVAHGDVLYRDVYDVTTPLPAWLGAAVVGLTTTELVVLRALVAAVVATQVLTACSIARRAGMQRTGRGVLAVTLVAFASPMVVFVSLYTACAVLGALVALRAVLWWLDGRDAGAAGAASAAPTAPLVWVGVAVAASFWSKPNVGLLALAATLVTVGVAGGRAWRTSARAAGVVLGVFAAVSVACSAVIVATGAWSAFVDQVFRSKREYLDVGFSFATAVERRADALLQGDPIDARAIVWLLVLATPVVVAAALAWACWRARRHVDPRLAGYVSFGVVGILGAVPRPGVDHLGSTLPLMVTAAACAVLSVPEPGLVLRARRGLLVAAGTVAVVAALVVAGSMLDTSTSTTADARTDVEHFSGTPVSKGVARRAARLRAGLHEHTDGRVFIVREDAGFLYLVTGTHDPLPFDIAERSDFGADGETGVIRRLEHGDAEWVCLVPAGVARVGRDGDDPLVPLALERWVRRHAELTAELPMCDLYRVSSRP